MRLTLGRNMLCTCGHELARLEGHLPARWLLVGVSALLVGIAAGIGSIVSGWRSLRESLVLVG